MRLKFAHKGTHWELANLVVKDACGQVWPRDLSLIPRTHMVEERNQLLQVVLSPWFHSSHSMCLTLTQINKCKKVLVLVCFFKSS